MLDEKFFCIMKYLISIEMIILIFLTIVLVIKNI